MKYRTVAITPRGTFSTVWVRLSETELNFVKKGLEVSSTGDGLITVQDDKLGLVYLPADIVKQSVFVLEEKVG